MPHLVSVVLPTYNRAETLERAIESVLNQTFTDFELIIIDDRSTDDTHLILSKYAGLSNVRPISQFRRGCSVARNIGISIARGRKLPRPVDSLRVDFPGPRRCPCESHALPKARSS